MIFVIQIKEHMLLVTEQLDILSNLSKLMYTSNVSQEIIVRILSSMIRIISVNLEYGNSFGKGQISLEIYEKNRLHLANVLSSCNRLSTDFVREMVSQLSE